MEEYTKMGIKIVDNSRITNVEKDAGGNGLKVAYESKGVAASISGLGELIWAIGTSYRKRRGTELAHLTVSTP